MGSEWVLYILLALSILSVAVIIERIFFYRKAARDLDTFRSELRKNINAGELKKALSTAESRLSGGFKEAPDFESGLSFHLLNHVAKGSNGTAPEILSEVAQDWILQTRIKWERNLSILASIGSNAPFVGLFGTVLGIIQAFHELSQKASSGAQTVTAGISEALIATAMGILVAIPAVVAFNLFQRKVKAALIEADALKSFLIGQVSGQHGKKS